MRISLTLEFIKYCFLIRANPWLFFQLHAKYFDTKKGIFSKLDIEKNIPKKWKLESIPITTSTTSKNILKKYPFPFYGKPEWGQNAHGISYIKNIQQLDDFLSHSAKSSIPYLIQPASNYENEYEICFLKDPENPQKILINSLVEAQNLDGIHVSSIHAETRYKELIHKITSRDCKKICSYISQMGGFSIGRVGLKSDSLKAIIDGKFEVFEINIFLPLPLKLLAYNIDISQKKIFLKKWAKDLAILTKNIPPQKYTEVFIRKIYLHYKIKILHKLR